MINENIKVGDRVVCIQSNDYAWVGEKGTITTSYSQHPNIVSVAWDPIPKRLKDSGDWLAFCNSNGRCGISLRSALAPLNPSSTPCSPSKQRVVSSIQELETTITEDCHKLQKQQAELEKLEILLAANLSILSDYKSTNTFPRIAEGDTAVQQCKSRIFEYGKNIHMLNIIIETKIQQYNTLKEQLTLMLQRDV